MLAKISTAPRKVSGSSAFWTYTLALASEVLYIEIIHVPIGGSRVSEMLNHRVVDEQQSERKDSEGTIARAVR